MIEIPDRETALREVEDGDWAGYFDRQQKRLNKSGSGSHGGTIVLTDSYPLNKTFKVESRVELFGAYRAKHHIGSSCGFEALPGFQGSWVVEWKTPRAGKYYSNFGAGLRQIHIQSVPGVGGVYFRGAQQSSGIDNVFVRGYGGAVGLRMGGDTYSVRDVFSDALKGGDALPRPSGSIAFDLGEKRVVSLRLENITAHDCEIGLRCADVAQVTIENFETELTLFPFVVNYSPRGINARNCAFRHTRSILKMNRVRWASNCLIKMDGQVSDNKPGQITLPDGGVVEVPKTFDLVVEATKQGVEVTNLREMRDFYREGRQSA